MDLPDPDVTEMFDAVYADPPAPLLAERAEAVAFRDSLDEGSES